LKVFSDWQTAGGVEDQVLKGQVSLSSVAQVSVALYCF